MKDAGRESKRPLPPRNNKQEAEALDPDVAIALQRMEEAKKGGKFYTTSEVIERLPTQATEEEIAEIKRRMAFPGPGFTTQEVVEYLQSLDPQES